MSLPPCEDPARRWPFMVRNQVVTRHQICWHLDLETSQHPGLRNEGSIDRWRDQHTFVMAALAGGERGAVSRTWRSLCGEGCLPGAAAPGGADQWPSRERPRALSPSFTSRAPTEWESKGALDWSPLASLSKGSGGSGAESAPHSRPCQEVFRAAR